jgi:D-tyrosyl-tRNA(Tyr) deacylase
MRVVVQRVRAARVEVEGLVVGEIGPGLCAFVGAGAGDDDADLAWMAGKLVKLRIFEDEQGKMARSLAEVPGAGMLLVSQFTLFGDLSRGNRPSFSTAMLPADAEPYFDRFVERVRAAGVRVATGRFGADMRVVVDNDGPVTIWLDSRTR